MHSSAPLPDFLLRFFGLMPEDEFRSVLETLQQIYAVQLGFRAMQADRLHLTLCAEGTAKKQRQSAELAMLAAGGATHARSFGLVFDRLRRFSARGGGYAIALVPEETCLGLRQLREYLRAAQLAEGFVIPRSGFSPHITLGYGKDIADVDIAIPSIHWQVRDFVLIQSHQGQSHYDELGRWELLP